MKTNLSRRRFLGGSVVAASTAAAFGFEEKVLLANDKTSPETPALLVMRPKDFPQSKIGSVVISRLICGGNLISGFAHSRDLIYVSRWLKEYFTDEKVFTTLALCEAEGINTAILRLDENTLRILRTYWKERGGKMQWIAQVRKYQWSRQSIGTPSPLGRGPTSTPRRMVVDEGSSCHRPQS